MSIKKFGKEKKKQYLCKVKKIWIVALIAISGGVSMLMFNNMSLIAGEWTKQTIYIWIQNCFHCQHNNAKPTIMLIDDDCGFGVYTIKDICDELQIKATFAVIPSMLTLEIKDSLKNWQKQGFNIALHGYNHDDWRIWSYEEIMNDINASEQWLVNNGIDTDRIKYVVAPRGSNTPSVRKAIKNKGYLMVTGANIINPDTDVFQNGRLIINKETDLNITNTLLRKAKKRNLFVIIGTHSSILEEFSKEKTKAVLQMAINMGFEYHN